MKILLTLALLPLMSIGAIAATAKTIKAADGAQAPSDAVSDETLEHRVVVTVTEKSMVLETVNGLASIKLPLDDGVSYETTDGETKELGVGVWDMHFIDGNAVSVVERVAPAPAAKRVPESTGCAGPRAKHG